MMDARSSDQSIISILRFAQVVQHLVDVPSGFHQVLSGVTFESCTPQVFHGIAFAEIHVLCDVDTLDTFTADPAFSRADSVVWRVIDCVDNQIDSPDMQYMPSLADTAHP